MSDKTAIHPNSWFITNFEPSLISFHNKDGKEVGKLHFNTDQTDQLIFTGDAHESAEVFFNELGYLFSERLKQEYKKGFADGSGG